MHVTVHVRYVICRNVEQCLHVQVVIMHVFSDSFGNNFIMTLQLKWCLHRGSVGQPTTAETHFTELSQCIHCACIMHLTNKRNLILVN